MNVPVVHHTLYILIVSISYVCQLCRASRPHVSHVWMSVQVCVKALFNLQKCPLLYAVPFECEDASVPVCVGMCWLFDGRLFSDY